MAVSFYELIPLTLYIIAALYAVLGLHAWRKRPAPAVTPFAWLMLVMAWWSFGYGLELYAQNIADKLFWAKVQYFGAVAIPTLWMQFSLEYTGREGFGNKFINYVLWAIPGITLLFVWTNDYHQLIWREVELVREQGLYLLSFTRGWWHRLFIFYSYGMILSGSTMSAMYALRLPRLYRSQAVAILAAVLIPWAGNVLYIFHLIPLQVDPSTFLFLPSGFCFAWAITRYHLLDIIPPTQSTILQSLRDGVVLLDRQRRILFMNTAAERILSSKSDECLGQPVEEVCLAPSKAILSLLGAGEQRVEIALTTSGQPRQYEIHITPMQSAKITAPELVSHLIIFHDVTERKQTKSTLHRREAILSAVSLASEQFLKSASWENNIQTVLEQMGRAANVSRAYVFQVHGTENGVSLLSQRYEWVADGIPPQLDNPDLQNLDWRAAGFARWEDTFQAHGMIFGPLRDFPASERSMLAAQEILSIVVMPVFVEEELWGFIGFDECIHERQWSEAELDALRTAADIFSAALARRNTEKRLISRQRSQNLLQEIIRAALGKAELQEMGLFLVDHLGILIGADLCFLAVWDETRERTVPVAAYGVSNELYRHMDVQPGEKTLTASALEAGHMLVVEDAENSPFVSPRLSKMFHTRSVLAIPMISNEKKLGAVLLGFFEPHRFTPEEIIVSEQATELVTLALAKFQAVEQAQRRADESETLRRAGTTVAEALNLQETTSRLLEQLAFVVPHDSASVQLLRGNELEIIGGDGWANSASVIGVRFPVPGDNPNTKVIETRQPVLIGDTYETYPIFRTTQHAAHIRSWLGVPLIVRDQLIGLLAIDSRQTNHFTQDHIQVVTAFASQVAVAVENARLFDEVQQLAITDGLTGLYNRRHFMELAKSEFERARRYKRHLSVMLFDIDHFKKVNDAHGHPMGDHVLRALAALCREKWRESDPIARYGGEEFIALIVEADAKIGRTVAERLRREVEKMIVPIPNSEIKITISIGISELDENTPTLESLISRADQALYSAKQKGRNRVFLKR